MAYFTKKQLQEQFFAEFLQRPREAPPGTRVYLPAGGVFRDADIHNLDELRAAHRAGADDDEGREPLR